MSSEISNSLEKKSIGKEIVNQITGIFSPVINIITAASILKGILMLLMGIGLVDAEGGVYKIFYACSDGFFYFLPFFLAYTASKQWKTDPFISMLIPVTMLYPDMVNILENGAGSMSFLGINIPPTVYHSSVLPVLFAIGLLIFIEKVCDKIIPEAIVGFTKPIICCLIVLPLTFLVFGPFGTVIGNALTGVFNVIYDFNPILAGAFMGFLIQPMVCVGAHWSIVPVCINNIATNGYDVILPLLGAAVYAQAGAVLAVGLLYKKSERNKEKRRVAFQASLAAVLGVTEPALFGVNLALVRPMITACIAGGIGGAMVGAVGTHCNSFAFPSFLTCVVYVGDGFGVFLLSMVVGFAVAFGLVFLQKRKISELIGEKNI
ncbi:MAG: PTS transporter subunit EIIC [Lachnospiraceae bacterium]|nr:PTS transporter subunit EIIC [Lachnospiraceae bacterium]